ncbi:RNB-domain-containing protein [Daedalea quercina L-15889]|uniref:RNB-domain-containing protein n=1 Tax=Daedalea quercina L-15889 TaxID=1314783 RepID=A0A165TLE1_9APHY|nr:RNB-domain-containing protein [Daedalea quercina L-15889]
MHRRGASRLADIASTSSAALSRTTQRHVSNAARNRRAPRERTLSKRTYDRVEVTTKGLVAAAAKKQNKAGWGHPQHYEGETRRLTAAVKSGMNPHKIPTPELQMLLATQDRSFDALAAVEYERAFRFEPGALVEIRRSESVFHGVVIESLPEQGVWLTFSLLSGGELWPHQESDVMFYVPDFVDRDLVTRCGIGHANSLKESEIAARVKVLKKLRNIEIASERRVTEIYHQLRSLYDQVRHPDPKRAATVTVEQAARVVMKDRPVDLLTRWAIHKYLFDKSRLFVAESVDFLERPTFMVRSKHEVEDLEAVNEMVARRDAVVDSFVAKAKGVIQAARTRERATWTHPPCYQVDDSITFTSEEMTIIRFFRTALRGMRTIQKDPYAVSLSYILKSVGLYGSQEFMPRSVHLFLVELGVIPPWVDPIERAHISGEDRRNSGLALLDGPITRDHSSSSAAVTTASTRPTQSLPLGPDDFYSRDLVDHLRHDFGNLPAYIIDDVDAEELDDAISVERIPTEPDCAWLHVHIADPTSVLPPTHRIAREAFSRMQTRYYLDTSVPMLPDVPQLRHLSLGEGRAQLVLTFSGKIDLEGNIVDYKIRPGIIRNARKLHYHDVSKAIGSPPALHKFPFGGGERLTPPPNEIGKTATDDILFAQQFTDALIASRLRHGAMQYAFPKAMVTVDTKLLPEAPPVTNRRYLWSGFPKMDFYVEDHQAQEQGARKLVAEYMRLGSRIASMWLRDRDIPALRRVSRPPSEAVPGAIQQLLKARDEVGYADFFLMQRLGILVGQASYELTPGPHSIVGVPDGEGYMRATSPLRRFLDMLTHWQIKHAMLSPDAPRAFPDEWLKDLAIDATWWDSYATRNNRGHVAWWAHKFLERWITEHKGSPEVEKFTNSLEAIVVGTPINNYHYQYWQAPSYLWDLGLKATIIRLEPDSKLGLGQRVPVKIASLQAGVTSSLEIVRR